MNNKAKLSSIARVFCAWRKGGVKINFEIINSEINDYVFDYNKSNRYFFFYLFTVFQRRIIVSGSKTISDGDL